jgi:hypothetical protein
MKRIIAVFMILMLLSSMAFADSLVTIYEDIKSDFPDFTNRLIAGGATEAEIEDFLVDLGQTVQDGSGLTEDNFEKRMYEALKEVLFIDGNMAMIQEEHFNFTVALLFEFTDEIEETLETKRLSGDLVALSEAVKNAVIDDEPSSSGVYIPAPVIAPPADLSILTVDELSLEVLLERAEALADSEGTSSLIIDFGEANQVNLPELQTAFETLDEIVLETGSGTIVLRAETLLPWLQNMPVELEFIRQAGDCIVLNMAVNSFPVTVFNQPVKIMTDYALSANQNGDHLTVVYEREDGNLENLGGVYRDGQMIFFTNHFSTFQIIESEKHFNDLDNAAFAKDKIEILASKGIISGKGEGIFDPDAPITRAETAALIARMLKLNSDSNSVPFTDIVEGKWYTDEVMAAYDSGLVAGKGNGRFDPLGLITRQEVTSILSRALVREGYEPIAYEAAVKRFNDGQISDWAKADIGLAIEQGLMRDLPEESLIPIGIASRVEVANMLYEMLDDIY